MIAGGIVLSAGIMDVDVEEKSPRFRIRRWVRAPGERLSVFFTRCQALLSGLGPADRAIRFSSIGFPFRKKPLFFLVQQVLHSIQQSQLDENEMYLNDATGSVRLEVAQILHGHCPSRRQIPMQLLVFLKFIET
jgi:hypothetical protein